MLPFGLSSVPYIFAKRLRTMARFWWQNSIKIVLCLDDRFGVSESERSCTSEQKQKYRGMFETQKSRNKTSSGDIGLNIRTLASPKVGQDQVSGGVSVLCWHAAPVANVLWKSDIDFVTHSLVNAGLILNNEKFILHPTQCLEWLSIMCDSLNFVLSGQDSLAVLRQVRGCFHRVTARLLAKCTGKVISLSPIIGNACRLMTRHCYKVIESRLILYGPLACGNIECVLNELYF